MNEAKQATLGAVASAVPDRVAAGKYNGRKKMIWQHTVLDVRRRRLLRWGWLTLALPSAARASIFPFIPSHYTFALAQIQEAVARRFPYRRQLATLAEVTLSNPLVGVLPKQNRLAIDFDGTLDNLFMSTPLRGQFSLQSGLLYLKEQRAVVLDTPQMTRVKFSETDPLLTANLSSAIGQLAAQWLDRYPVYRFKPEQLKFAGVEYEPGQIQVTSRGVKVEILEHKP